MKYVKTYESLFRHYPTIDEMNEYLKISKITKWISDTHLLLNTGEYITYIKTSFDEYTDITTSFIYNDRTTLERALVIMKGSKWEEPLLKFEEIIRENYPGVEEIQLSYI